MSPLICWLEALHGCWVIGGSSSFLFPDQSPPSPFGRQRFWVVVVSLKPFAVLPAWLCTLTWNISLWEMTVGELCAERDLISFPIKKPCKNRVVQHSQAATRGHRQPRQQGLPSLPHSLPGRMEYIQVPPASDPLCSLLSGKYSCSFPALLGKGIGQLESGKERKDLDFCKGWSGEMRH